MNLRECFAQGSQKQHRTSVHNLQLCVVCSGGVNYRLYEMNACTVPNVVTILSSYQIYNSIQLKVLYQHRRIKIEILDDSIWYNVHWYK